VTLKQCGITTTQTTRKRKSQVTYKKA